MVHIAENLQKARQYARSVNTVEEFKTVPMVKESTMHLLQNASEAATRLRAERPEEYAELVARHPEVPWKRFHDLGNVYRHNYDNIDLEMVWEDLRDKAFVAAVERAMSSEIAFLNFEIEKA